MSFEPVACPQPTVDSDAALFATLAATASHDLGNLLVIIGGYSELIAAGEIDAKEACEQISTAATRGADICRHLSTLATDADGNARPTNVSSLVRDSRTLLSLALSKRCQLSLSIEEEDLYAVCSVGGLRRVLLNLVLSAVEAIEARGAAGVVEVRVACRARSRPGWARAGRGTPPSSQDVVVIEVADNGCGMSPEALETVFEKGLPATASGSGLGLVSATMTAERFGGSICIESAPGEGTAVFLAFPCAESATVEGPDTTDFHVLVVDDDDLVRSATRMMLESRGMRVTAVSRGGAAIEAVRRSPADFDAVVIDVVMPGVWGTEALESIRELRSDLPAVLVSGQLRRDTLHPAANIDQPLTIFLKKPFTPSVLCETLNRAVALRPNALTG